MRFAATVVAVVLLVVAAYAPGCATGAGSTRSRCRSRCCSCSSSGRTCVAPRASARAGRRSRSCSATTPSRARSRGFRRSASRGPTSRRSRSSPGPRPARPGRARAPRAARARRLRGGPRAARRVVPDRGAAAAMTAPGEEAGERAACADRAHVSRGGSLMSRQGRKDGEPGHETRAGGASARRGISEPRARGLSGRAGLAVETRRPSNRGARRATALEARSPRRGRALMKCGVSRDPSRSCTRGV